MSPDSPETRIARLEQKVAKLEQRVEDLLVSISTQFKALDEDVRAFGPMVREVDGLKNQLGLALTEAKAARADASTRPPAGSTAPRSRPDRYGCSATYGTSGSTTPACTSC